MMWVAKYWKQIAIAALIAVLCVAWRIDRASQYRAGKAAATAHISAALAEVHASIL